MSLYYVVLSGNNNDLAWAEVESLLHLISENVVVRWNGKLGLIESELSPISLLLERAALVREVGRVLVEATEYDTLFEGLTEDVLSSVGFGNDSFSITYHELEKIPEHGEKQRIIERLGAKIQKLTDAPVSLRQPETCISIVFARDSYVVGIAFESSQRKVLDLREPSKKPFFHPSMMNSILARVMCNIAEVKPGQLVLDPFCGGGGILCEASLIGARVVGVDMNWKLLQGAKTNLIDQGTHQFSLLQGDTRFLPIRRYNRIVTDPPYGRSSSTRGAHAISLIEAMLEQVPDSGERLVLCVCTNQEMYLRDTFIQYGLSVESSVLVPVHSGLTREVFKVKN